MKGIHPALFATRRTISRDLTLSLTLMTAVVFFVFGAAYQSYYANREASNLEKETALVADEFIEVLARPRNQQPPGRDSAKHSGDAQSPVR